MKVKAGPVTVQIRIDPNLGVKEGLWGEYDPNGDPDPLVRLAPGMQPRTFAMTVLHELLHHVDEAHGIGLREWQIRCIEQGLSGLMVDNPRLAVMWAKGMLSEGK